MNANLKIALRVLHRERQYALLNIGGLALAIGCSLILALFVRSELTYDQHNVLHEQIYRVASEITVGDGETRLATTSEMLGPMLADFYPEIQAYTRLRRIDQDMMLFREVASGPQGEAFYWEDVYFADANVFSVFTHDVLYGDPDKALIEPVGVAVSETFARKHFGDANAVGKRIANERGVPLQINLVFSDLPENTHVKYDVLMSFESPLLASTEDPMLRRLMLWFPTVYTYLVLPENYDVDQFHTVSENFFEQHMLQPGRTERWRSWLQPLDDIHLYSDVAADRPTGNRYYLYAFVAVAAFMLLVACINHVNLATARATKRVRGVGIRKILGAPRAPLVLQFLAEGVIFAFIATVLGLVAVEVAFSATPLRSLLGKPLRLDLFGDPAFAAGLLGFSVVIGLVASAYPAIQLSSWTPLSALISSGQASKRSAGFRKVLVFVQLTVSIAVIATTMLMASQMRFIANMPLGFAKENRVIVTLRGADVIERLPTIINELSNHPGILGVTTSETKIGSGTLFSYTDIENASGGFTPIMLSNLAVGPNFFSVMDLKLQAGRTFDRRLLTDIGTSFVVNEALARTMNWDEPPLGKRIRFSTTAGAVEGYVIGVVTDFNSASLHLGMTPLFMYLSSRDMSKVPTEERPYVKDFLILNVAGEGISRTLSDIGATISKFDPIHPFEFQFLEDSLNDLYTSDQRLMQLIAIFAGICVLIACLGLYGLTAYSAEQRTREIGTRKVLGATPTQIIWLLAKPLVALLLVGAVVGSFLAYFAFDTWLTSFAYRVAVNPLMFVAATAMAAIVTFATVALQCSGVARRDPVDALRYE